jgi:hypothetical protein
MGVSESKVFLFRGARRGAVERPFPAGGLFLINRLDLTKCLAMQEQLERTDFVRDDKTGEILYNKITGAPVTRKTQDFSSIVEFVETQVLAGWRNVDWEIDRNGELVHEPMPYSEENVRLLLNYIPDDPNDALLAWLIGEAVGVAQSSSAAAKKT